MTHPYRVTALAFLALSGTIATAQTPQPAPAPTPAPLVGSIAGHPDWPAAKPEDIATPQAIVDAVYASISGPKDQPRDTNRLRSLFIPDARLIPTIQAKDSDHADAAPLTIDQYIARSSGGMMKAGFFEHSIHNEMEQFGNIVQIWSTYESRRNADDPKPFARGINSFQLLKDGNRYWVVNIYWGSESPAHPIPSKYLP
jgi:hypothetical protein